jgi:hypothetical protein
MKPNKNLSALIEAYDDGDPRNDPAEEFYADLTGVALSLAALRRTGHYKSLSAADQQKLDRMIAKAEKILDDIQEESGV